MSAHEVMPGAVESAAGTLAGQLAEAIRGRAEPRAEPFCLHRRVAAQAEPVPALAAVRVLGADALTAALLAGHAFPAADAALVHAAVGAFPAPPEGAADRELWAWRDQALAGALGELGVATDGWEGLATTAGTADPAEPPHWVPWCVDLARLSSLALPPLASPLRDQARRHRLDLTRGMTRALLRRDHLSAARLARWLALDHQHAPEPLLAPAIEHLEQLAFDQPRTMLETVLARYLLEGGR